MKYNYLPRILCILLVMVMISTIGVGYTFSKYIVDDAADDNARITHFGVTTGVQAGAFSTVYKNGEVITVKSSADTENVLAPGTNGTFSGINVQGTPEVRVKVTTTADMELGNNWKSGGIYYCPLRITVGTTEYYGMDYSSADEFESVIEGAITTVNAEYDVGTNLANIPGLNGNYSWRWDFKGTDGKQTTARDTDLGDAAATGNAAIFSLVVTAKVEQVD